MSKKINWEEIKSEIEHINKIVDICDKEVKEKCFELMFNLAFGTQNFPVHNAKMPEGEKLPINPSKFTIKGNVLAMIRKNGLSEADLEKLFILDHEPIMPIYKIDSANTANAQLQKVFMILLQNALTSGMFKSDYAEIRETCKEDGLWDGNFAKNLKSKVEYFKGAISKDSIDESGIVELSGPGLTKLAEIIKQLSQ